MGLWKRVLIVVLVVSLVIGQISIAPAQNGARAVRWGDFAVAVAASAAIVTGVQFVMGACAAYCASIWSAVTIGAAGAASILGAALFYGSVLGLGAVAAYMLYKGWTWVNGVLMAPGATTYTIADGHAGTMSWSDSWGTYQVSQVLPCNGTTTGWDSQWWGAGHYGANVRGWGAAEWQFFAVSRTGPSCPAVKCDFVFAVRPSSLYCSYVVAHLNESPVSIDDVVAGLGDDLAGTNGSVAQDKAMAALTAAITGAIADGFNRFRDGNVTALGIPESKWNQIAGILEAALSAADLAKLQDKQNARDNTAYIPNATTDSMTKTDYRDAVRDGVSDALSDLDIATGVYEGVLDALIDYKADVEGSESDGNATPPLDLTPPGAVESIDAGNATSWDKLSITGVLDTFWAALSGLPIVDTFNSIGVISGGSPVITVTIPAIFDGGSQQTLTINFDEDAVTGTDYGTILGYVGDMLLVITSISWLIFLLV